MSPVTGLDQPRLVPASLEDRLLGGLGRLSGCALFLVVAALWISVLSWSNADPSLGHATANEPRNWLGAPGAIVAGLLIETLGLSTLVVMLAPMLWAAELVARGRVDDFRVKAAYFPLSVVLLAGALSTMAASSVWPLEQGYGGILGDMVLKWTTAAFAVINPERAAFAATLLLIGTGLSALSRGTGVGLKDIVRALASAARPRRPRTALRGLIGRVSALRAAFSRRGEAPFAPWPSERREPVFGPPIPMEGESAENHVHERRRASPYLADAAVIDGGADALTLDHLPLNNDETAARGPEFDLSTDVSSRMIAARFAPNQPQRPAVASLSLGQSLRSQMQMLGPVAPKEKETPYRRPAVTALERPAAGGSATELSQTVLRGTARLLEDVLADFGVKGEVRDIKPGPVVTLFEFEPARGTKTSRIVALADDIGRSMSAKSARVAPVPGRNAVGIELPNARRQPVGLRELLESEAFRSCDGALPLALGKSIGGDPVVADLARMPHLLIAGTTGSGKSVGLNAMILSLLFRHSPDQCRFLMIDPKMLELSVYNGIPHLLCPVVTEPQRAVQALGWAVGEMEERYKLMSRLGVRNIEAFNERLREARRRGEPIARTVQTGFDAMTGEARYERDVIDPDPMPCIVVVVDEFADLMIASGKEIEGAVQRLAQKARAAGIHLIMATQRPSVDIITGTIKANFPTRISFKVASKIDSRTILNDQGAEQLLGQGDMLFASGSGQVTRVHAPMVSDAEVDGIVSFLRRQGSPRYVDGIGTPAACAADDASDRDAEASDSLYDRAVAVVLRDRKASTSYIQRRLAIGYNRAADLIERMERDGLIGPPGHAGRREIMVGGTAPPQVA